MPLENWSPSQALGTRNGKNAAKHVRQIGFPEGVNVWLDLEGAKTSTPHETMIAYCNAWFAEVEGCGIRTRSGSQGNSGWGRAVLAFNDQTLLEVRKQGSRHSIAVISSFRRSSATTRSTVLQSTATSPRTTTLAALCGGCPRVEPNTRKRRTKRSPDCEPPWTT